MPDEVKITRRQVIVVGEIKGMVGDQYPKWVFTDKDGKEYKVNPKRTQYFEDVKSGLAVEISFTTFKGTEYPYNAVAVDTSIPEPSTDEQFNALKGEQKAKGDVPKSDMSKNDWAEKDRITRKSIERQTALKEANLRVMASESADEVVRVAKVFEGYIEGEARKEKDIVGAGVRETT